MLVPLWDADVLRYQVGFAAETHWELLHKEKGVEIDVEDHPPPFDLVEESLLGRINSTHEIVGATAPPIMFFTGKTNFRNEISSTGYKLRGGRKPFHYYNIEAYLKGAYAWEEKEGLEADDLLGITSTILGDKAIIISIDKDLLQLDGWHYHFEFGKVPSFGPIFIKDFGDIWLDDKNKLRGYGEKFFYAQCIMGDSTDSIIGIPKSGPVAAFKRIGNTNTPLEAFKAAREAYRGFYGDLGDQFLLENGRLLHMTRKLNEDGTPVLWKFPEGVKLFEKEV